MHANEVAGYAEAAKENFFDIRKKSIAEENYAEVFQSLDKIHQYADQFISEYERKNSIKFQELEDFPDPNLETEYLADYLQNIRNEVESISSHLDLIYKEESESTIEENLVEDMRQEIKMISKDVYGWEDEFNYIETSSRT